VLNPAIAELRHLRSLPDLHPHRLYLSLARLHAALATLLERAWSPAGTAAYSHEDAGPPLIALHVALHRHLGVTLQSAALALPVTARSYGVFTALIEPSAVGVKSRLVIQVRSALPAELLRARWPSMVKIGPADAIRDLVNTQLPGLQPVPMPAVPLQVPYAEGAAYFELKTEGSELWQRVLRSGALALHVAGDFPQLEIGLWLVES
jgi:type VI secretion system protein ImpJ